MNAPAKAIFLSYASQDTDAAQRLCDALRAVGLEVWFDQSELRGGDAWGTSIRSQIKDCALFVPMVSAHTDERSKGYFRREWSLAVDRMQDIADDQPFLLPVVIDATSEATARVPERFRERQWSRLDGGQASPEFIARVARLLAGDANQPINRPRTAQASTAPQRRRWLVPALALSAALVVSAVAFVWWGARGQREGSPASVAAPSPLLDRKAVAVLPFDNLSGRIEDAYLAGGLHEEVLNALAPLRDLRVISRSSVMEYSGQAHNVREIGRRLGVGTLLEGSIRRDGNTLRLTVQLIDANDDRHLLAANYDRDLGHVLDLQSAVAKLVADSLAAALSRMERGELDRIATNSGDAYDRYLRAATLFRAGENEPKDTVEMRRLLADALRFDPDYADAQALLSQVNTWSFLKSSSADDAQAAKLALERALAIDPKLPEAQLARGLYAMYVVADLDQALADLQAVVQLRPNSAYAHVALSFALRRRARFAQALDHQLRAWDLDPLNDVYSGPPMITLLGLRRIPEAIELTALHLRRFPGNADHHVLKALIEWQLQGKTDALGTVLREHGKQIDAGERAILEVFMATDEGRYLDAARLWAGFRELDPIERDGRVGCMYLAAGDHARAEQTFAAAERGATVRLKRQPALSGNNDFMVWLAVVQSMQGKHAPALATIDAVRANTPEAKDAINGPQASFYRSILLVRAGRSDEGYAEVTRLLQVPFGSPLPLDPAYTAAVVQFRNDKHFNELIHRPPRL